MKSAFLWEPRSSCAHTIANCSPCTLSVGHLYRSSSLGCGGKYPWYSTAAVVCSIMLALLWREGLGCCTVVTVWAPGSSTAAGSDTRVEPVVASYISPELWHTSFPAVERDSWGIPSVESEGSDTSRQSAWSFLWEEITSWSLSPFGNPGNGSADKILTGISPCWWWNPETPTVTLSGPPVDEVPLITGWLSASHPDK